LQQTHIIVDLFPSSTSSSLASTATSLIASTTKSSIRDQPSSGTNSTTNPIPAASASSTAIADAAHSTSSSLSAGAKAGIGIGVVLRVLGKIAVIVAVFLSRRTRRTHEAMMTRHNGGTDKIVASNNAEDNGSLSRRHSGSLVDSQAAELQNSEIPHEMGSGGVENYQP
jgi:hypothetical protein